MRGQITITALLIAATLLAPACATMRAREEFDALIQHGRENTEAWMAARLRLREMCSAAAPSCGPRYVKATNQARTDDWGWEILPPYTTIVAVHEDEFRRRHSLKVYEEFMLASARYLAERIERREITHQQLAEATNQAWRWMIEQFKAEGIMLIDGVRLAQEADARAWERVNVIASSLAVVLSAAVIASASQPAPAAFAPTSTPTYCFAMPVRNVATGQVMSVSVTCR